MSKVEFNKIIFKVTPTTCTNRPNTEGMLPVSSLVFLMKYYVAGSYDALMAKLGNLESVQAL